LVKLNPKGKAFTVKDVFINDGAANTYVASSAPVSSGASLIIAGDDQKIVLLAGDKVYVQSSAASWISKQTIFGTSCRTSCQGRNTRSGQASLSRHGRG